MQERRYGGNKTGASSDLVLYPVLILAYIRGQLPRAAP